MNQAIVLCYNMEGARADAVRALAMKAGIQPFLVPREAFAQKIGALCGVLEPTSEEYTGEGFGDEMMLMAFLEKGMLSNFLDSFRDSGVPVVPLKAMLTENNSQWDSIKLHSELSEEYLFFKNLNEKTRARKA